MKSNVKYLHFYFLPHCQCTEHQIHFFRLFSAFLFVWETAFFFGMLKHHTRKVGQILSNYSICKTIQIKNIWYRTNIELKREKLAGVHCNEKYKPHVAITRPLNRSKQGCFTFYALKSSRQRHKTFSNTFYKAAIYWRLYRTTSNVFSAVQFHKTLHFSSYLETANEVTGGYTHLQK